MVDKDGWTKKERQELKRLIEQAEQLEAEATRLNKLADAKDRLAGLREQTAEASRR